MQVLEAFVQRAVDKDGIRCAEVEVKTDSTAVPDVLVYFAASPGNDFDMVEIIRTEADFEVDWFDNTMHRAYENVTNEWFANMNMKSDWGTREAFKEQVLASGEVRTELAKLLYNELTEEEH